jgi:hypothetical protein
MSETDPPISQPAEPPAVAETVSPIASVPAQKPSRRISSWPFFLLFIFLLLAAGEAYLWHLIQIQTAEDVQFTALQAQISNLQAQTTRAQPSPDSVTVQADLAVKLATLAAQVNAVQAQMAADHGALSTLQANSTDLTKLTARISLLNQLETARMALDAGQPLGNIPNAPPALAQFATTPPPTEAQLRLNFPPAARAAEAASIAGDSKGTYWSRVLARLENFVTIREGAHVLVGAPAAGVISEAGTLLEAGDLAGAVAQLDTLSLGTQQAMSGWLAQAKSLLDARAALMTMAGQA